MKLLAVTMELSLVEAAKSSLKGLLKVNRSTCVPAETIAPLINSEGKIAHLVASGNAMKQG